jgi:hypothetical protein
MDSNRVGGLCFGLSDVALLAKTGRINPGVYQLDAGYIKDLKPSIGKTRLFSLFDYYFMIQFVDPYMSRAIISMFDVMGHDRNIIKKIESMSESSSLPALLSFQLCDGPGHAVIATGIEEGQWQYAETQFNRRVIIYDINSFGKNENDYHLYYSSDDYSWYIPYYKTGLATGSSKLKYVTDDLYELDPFNLDAALQGETPPLRRDDTEQFTIVSTDLEQERLSIENSGGERAVIDGLESSGDLVAVPYTDSNVLPDGSVADTPLNIALERNDEIYSVTADSEKPMDMAAYFMDSLMTANSDGAAAAVFDGVEDKVSIRDNSGAFELSITLEEEASPLPWPMMAVSGDNSENPSMEKASTGFELFGEDLNNIVVVGANDDETKDLRFSTDDNAVLIGSAEDGELAVFTDEDEDGEYETMLTASSGSQTEDGDGKNNGDDNRSGILPGAGIGGNGGNNDSFPPISGNQSDTMMLISLIIIAVASVCLVVYMVIRARKAKAFLRIGKLRFALYMNIRFYSWQTGDLRINPFAALAEVVQNPQDMTLFGLKNISSGPWNAMSGGKAITIAPGRIVPLKDGMKIKFANGKIGIVAVNPMRT